MEKEIEAIVSAPSVVLEKGIDVTKKFGKDASDLTRLKKAHGFWRSLGPGLITGAADDDPSAIGTYASAGAKLGPSFLWTAPATMPMMFAVVYLSAKLGQVTGRGLFEVIREHYSPWILRITLIGVLFGNTIEAAADIGGMAAALALLVPAPPFLVVTLTTVAILVLQVWGSYQLIRDCIIGYLETTDELNA